MLYNFVEKKAVIRKAYVSCWLECLNLKEKHVKEWRGRKIKRSELVIYVNFVRSTRYCEVNKA